MLNLDSVNKRPVAIIITYMQGHASFWFLLFSKADIHFYTRAFDILETQYSFLWKDSIPHQANVVAWGMIFCVLLLWLFFAAFYMPQRSFDPIKNYQ
jgi:hypothetical protein